MFRRLAPLFKLVAAILLTLVLADAVVYRSGLYARLIEPESTAGTLLGGVRAARHFRDPARKNVLVLGNSQVGLGFSAPTADAASGRPDMHFINASVAGTSPRVWNYQLREADPEANRYAAIVMMVAYDSFGLQVDPANYPLDTSYVTPILRLSDLADFPASFHVEDQRERARRAILLPLQALHEDVRAFLANPFERLHKVSKYWPRWLADVAEYRARNESVPELAIEPDSGQPRSWENCPEALRGGLRDYFAALHAGGYGTPALQAVGDAYLREWVGRIASRYRANGVPTIVFVVPRGPFHRQLAPLPVPSGAIAYLIARGEILALPGDAFVTLEQPQFFFDQLHMNHAGQERFSVLFAQKIAALVAH